MIAFHELIDGLSLTTVTGAADRSVTDVTDDSREVGAGTVFVARRGERVDGAGFIRDALSRGAAGIVSEQPPEEAGFAVPEGVAWAVAERVDPALVGRLAERVHGEPSRRLKLIGVTGTNGKTTTAFVVAHLLRQAGTRCGLLGTVYEEDGGGRRASTMTTPGPAALSRRLKAMVDNGCEAAVMEVSSHALAQGRADALAFDAAVFTNLSGDHLDYHASMEAYGAAKARLFDLVGADGWAVVNADDPNSERMVAATSATVIRCRLTEPGASAGAPEAGTCTASVLKLGDRVTRARFEGPWGGIEADVPLIGEHNVMNALEAMAAAHAVDGIGAGLQEGLETCPQVPGRLERIEIEAGDEQGRPTVLVDYAHTHDALENVLRTLRPLTRGHLVVVFGCGGDRDRTKRPKMAAVACAGADRVVVTSDNPRSENLMRIIDDIMAGVTEADRARVRVEPERRKAILTGVMMAGRDDVVLIAGKGHETYQLIGNERRRFDDREEAANALALWSQDSEIRHRFSRPPSSTD